MNLHPSDYLADLNLDFDRTNVSPEEGNQADLDLFTETEFFDLDVFSSDFQAPSKEQQAKQLKHNDEMVELSQYVKTEPQDDVVSFSGESTGTPMTYMSADFGPEKQAELNEIKRKRNTAASARFRVKKKLKEKQMEEQARELQERLNALEKKLKTLEMENKCLKQLILEKNEKKNCDLLDSIKKRTLGDSAFTFTS